MSREMKNSGIDWIGDIPVGWDVVPFHSYARERAEKNKGEKTRELLALSFALGVTLYRDKVFNKDRVKENFEDYQLVYENDLVLSPNDIIKGSVFVSKYYGCISPMYLVFSVRDANKYHLPYLSFLLRTREAGRKFFFLARGLIGEILENGKYVTRRMTVSRQDLMQFKVLLPSLSEQQAIADFLDKKCNEIDELVALQEKMIEELKSYKQSVITEAVCKGLNPNIPMKDSGVEWIGKMPIHWEIRRLKYIGKSENGLTYSPNDLCENSNDGILVLRSSNIQEGKLVFTDNVYVKDAPSILHVKKGDIILCSRNGSAALVGKSAIVNSDIYATFGAFMMRFRSNHHTEYIHYLLTAAVSQYKQLFSTTTINQLTIGVFGNLEMPFVVSRIEQQEIADYLDKKCSEIDQLISIKQQKIVELKDYKKSLIYEYTTGKKEVKL